MKILIAEDDPVSSLLLQTLLQDLFQIREPLHTVQNGKEAVAAVQLSLEKEAPYDLICLDLMMPEMNGHEALKEIRALEENRRRSTRILMVTALTDLPNVITAYRARCDGYLGKPLQKSHLWTELRRLKLLP